jgi:hypothetical protein
MPGYTERKLESVPLLPPIRQSVVLRSTNAEQNLHAAGL